MHETAMVWRVVWCVLLQSQWCRVVSLVIQWSCFHARSAAAVFATTGFVHFIQFYVVGSHLYFLVFCDTYMPFCLTLSNRNLFTPAVLWRCWLGGRKGIRPVKNMRVVGVGASLVRMGWRPLELPVPLPALSPLAPQKIQKNDGVQPYWFWV